LFSWIGVSQCLFRSIYIRNSVAQVIGEFVRVSCSIDVKLGKDARPTDFVELRFIKELDDSGFIDARLKQSESALHFWYCVLIY